MSEAAPPEGAAPAAKDTGAKPKASKAVVLMLVLNLGATGFGVFKLLNLPQAEAAKPAAVSEKTTKEVTGPVVPLDPFVVNLDEPGATSRYLKITLQLELVDHKDEELVEKSKQVIRDEVLRHLSGLKLKDTLGVQAKDTLRDQLMKEIEDIVGPGKVRRMFFQEFVVQ
jgi:flagellar protein FliL